MGKKKGHLKVCGNVVRYCGPPPKKTKKKPAPRMVEGFYRRSRRRHNSLLRLLHSIKIGKGQRPFWFVSLINPKKKAFKMSAAKLRSQVDRLARHIRYQYPSGWFVYVIEWSKKSGFHIHLLGRADGTKREIKNDLFNVWSRLTKSRKKNIVHVRPLHTAKAVRIRRGYLLKRSKYEGRWEVAKLFERGYHFGLINKQNCPRHPDVKIELSQDCLRVFRALVIADTLPDSWEPSASSATHIHHILNRGAGLHVMKSKRFVNQFLRVLEILSREED